MGAPLHCIFCGTANGPGDRFCRLCRQPLGSPTEPPAPAVGPARQTSMRSGMRNHATALLVAAGMVLAASATAVAARGPLLDLAAHVVPQLVQAPANAEPAGPLVPAATTTPAHAPAALPTCGPASKHGQGAAEGRARTDCTSTATPKAHGQPERTAKPHATPEPQGLQSAPGRSSTDRRVQATTGAQRNGGAAGPSSDH
jgi:hypothetical protein